MDTETRTLITTLTQKLRDLRAGARDQGDEGEEVLKFVSEAGKLKFNAFWCFFQRERTGDPCSLDIFQIFVNVRFLYCTEHGLSSLSKAFQVAQNKGIHPRPSTEYVSEEGGTIQYGSPQPRSTKK